MTIRVYGIPKGCGRPRARRAGAFVRVHRAGVDDDWKSCVRAACRETMMKEQATTMVSSPIRVDTTYWMPRPKSLKKNVVWHTNKPDRDNLDKSTLDAMVQAGLLPDDRCVCDGRIEKRYCSLSTEPGATIVVSYI